MLSRFDQNHKNYTTSTEFLFDYIKRLYLKKPKVRSSFFPHSNGTSSSIILSNMSTALIILNFKTLKIITKQQHKFAQKAIRIIISKYVTIFTRLYLFCI